MSRHRFVTNINKRSTGSDYSDDEEDLDEWNGSPSSASPATSALYTYDRNRQQTTSGGINLNNFVTKPQGGRKIPKPEDPYEDDEDYDLIQQYYPQVYEMVDQSYNKEEVIDALRKYNFDVNKTVSYLFDKLDQNKRDDLFDMDMEPKTIVPKVHETTKPAEPLPITTKSEPATAITLDFSNTSLESDISNLTLSGGPKTPKKEEEKTPAAEPPRTPKQLNVKQMTASRRREIEGLHSSKKDDKEHINLIVIGHVDAGKSTLMGHLLHLLGQVSDKVMHKYEKESKNIGKGSFSYAWVLDEHEEERQRGITMDVCITSFETQNKRVTLLDAPGHRDFVPNMISGAAQADVAILVIDAIDFEAGFENDGQTKEHALLAKSLGVQQIGVAVNKLDMLDWSQERFDVIVSKLTPFLKQSGFKNPWALPISGLTGENMLTRQEPKLSWYTGQTLVERINEFQAAPREVTKPFRFCISDIYKATALGIAVGGKVEAGMISVGDKLLLMPLSEVCSVKAIKLHGQNVEFAVAGDNVDIGLQNIEITHLSIGNILCDPENPVTVAQKFKASIITFALKKPVLKGQTTELYYQSVSEPAVITDLIGILDKNTGNITKKKPRALGDQTTALVEIKLQHPLCIEKYSDFKSLGRFTLREAGRTIAAGIITEIVG